MASRLNPYLTFKNNARQAMEFYQSVLGGTLNVTSFADFGVPDGGDGVMHAMLETPDGFTLMASDLPPDMQVQQGNNITVSLSGDDADALRGYWEKLSAGGTVTMRFEKQAWGDEFGSCVDKFGVPWMVNIGQPA